MQLSPDGAQHFPGELKPADLGVLEEALATLPLRPGHRLAGIPALSALLAPSGSIGRLVVRHLWPAARPVRALLFNKTADRNWALGWHQDRTIAVRARREVSGFANWTLKSGMQHVEPPFALLERMLTLRIHFDPVSPDNAPLLVAPGSHRLGRIPETNIAATVDRLGIQTCLADRSDIWLYATPILHASEAATAPRARRVLQVDFTADELPPGLEWLGV